LKIGVISDTHGDAATWRKVREEYFRDADYLIHAGDVLYHGPRNPLVAGYDPRELARLINESDIPIVAARGNCDADVDQLVLNYPLQAPYAFLRESGFSILVNHGDKLARDEMVQLARRFRVDLFIFGHIHEPVLDVEDGVILLNPGSCALPKGDGPPTVAVIDGGKIAIIDINSGNKLSVVTIR